LGIQDQEQNCTSQNAQLDYANDAQQPERFSHGLSALRFILKLIAVAHID